MAEAGSAGALVVATDQGGVWLIQQPDSVSNPTAAMPLDDWDHPDVNCLCQGPDDPNHVYAGCSGALYETVATVGHYTITKWREVKFPNNPGNIYSIAVVTSMPQRIVVACDQGLYWSPIPSPGGNYSWKLATGIPNGAYFGVAVGLGKSNQVTVVASTHDQLPDPIRLNSSYGMYFGTWDGAITDLVMDVPRQLATVIATLKMTNTSIATCRDQPSYMYAVSRDPTNGEVLGVIRSKDGGETWEACGTNIDSPWGNSRDIISYGGSDQNGGRQKTISVSPTDPKVVAFG
jgi:hypothetical protein